MPQSAIATGLVDLPVARIPSAIIHFARTEPRVPTPTEDNELAADAQRLLQNVFALILARTNRDFSQYKRSTILRRIARRM
jgi:two-component system CheB/CheR fusion protein